MPRQFGKVDLSATWACPRCPYKHAPLAACPPPGTWLVLHLCPACNERTGLYCRTHRDRHMPTAGDIPVSAPERDVQQLRTGEFSEEGAA